MTSYVPVFQAGSSKVHLGYIAGRYPSGAPRYAKACGTSYRDHYFPSPLNDRDTPVTCKRCLAKLATMAPGTDPLDGIEESEAAYVRRIDRMSKGELIALIYRNEPRDQWLIGGPDVWSHDELVNYVARNELDR